MSGPLPKATQRGQALTRDLAGLLGGGAASCDPIDLWAASRDCWPRARLWLGDAARFAPEAVCWPREARQVVQVLEFAAQRAVPVVTMGGGSSGLGASLPVRGGIVLDTKRLSAAPRIDLPGRTVDVRAGMLGARLEEQLAAVGATLGHFPEDRAAATVGGWMATRSGGVSAGRYGKIEDLVLSLEAVSGAGEQLRTIDGPTAGPDLAQLLLGSEGTLCVFTAARLRVYPKPRVRYRRAIRCASFGGGLRAAQALVRAGLRPSRLEVLDALSAVLAGFGNFGSGQLPPMLRGLGREGTQRSLRLLLGSPRIVAALAETLPSALLVFEFEADGPDADADVEEDGAEALRLCAGPGEEGTDLGARPADGPLGSRSGAMLPLFAAAGAFVERLDLAAGWERLPAVLAAVRKAVSGRALVRCKLSHAYEGGGALELDLLGPPGPSLTDLLDDVAPAAAASASAEDEPDEDHRSPERAAEDALAAALTAAADAGATLSHHRGVGLARALHLPREQGEGMRALRALKQAFDPRGILNPGKLLL